MEKTNENLKNHNKYSQKDKRNNTTLSNARLKYVRVKQILSVQM